MALTGCADDAREPPLGDPAWAAVLGGARITPDGGRSSSGSFDDLLLLTTPEVRAVDRFLQRIDSDLGLDRYPVPLRRTAAGQPPDSHRTYPLSHFSQ